MAQSGLSTSLHFTPILDGVWIWVAVVCAIVMLVFSFFAYKRGLVLRVAVFSAFLLALLNPSLLKEERSYVKDVAVVVVDRSSSQSMEKRTQRTDIALENIKKQIDELGAYELRVIEAPLGEDIRTRTDLFGALDQALVDVPAKRRAGVIFLSDGQIHDVPKSGERFLDYGPVHLLLSGRKDETDRQIVVTHAPAYGLVGKDVTIKYKVEDTRNIGQDEAQVTLDVHDGAPRSFFVPVGQEQSISVKLEHPGQNVFSLSAAVVAGEITQANNKSAVIINGVRDRLKVMLISGIPHAGERTWRDLLTSDPGVDLVHFTILREPQKFDYTPNNELSLIAFPYQELFEHKIYDFDLIIFDHYQVNGILTDRYFSNIVRYVQEGGAFLESSGPAFADNRSIYDTPLGDILPGRPSGKVVEQRYVPSLSKLGFTHPVTRSLVWRDAESEPGKPAPWGAWGRYIDITPLQGDVLMNGPDDKPLLVLDRVGKGRVAQLSSDHIWLWSRGYDSGGPHATLLRRIVHWLMKEPELDERALNVRVHKNIITVEKQAYGKSSETLAMTTSDGESIAVELKADGRGLLSFEYRAQQLGVYVFEDAEGVRKFAIVGDLDPPELRGVKSSAALMAPLVEASGGTNIWLEDNPKPAVRSLGSMRRYGGEGWLALRQNNDFTVSGVRDITLLPEWVTLLLLCLLVLLLWWREGQSR